MSMNPGTISGTVTSPIDLPAGAPLNPSQAPAALNAVAAKVPVVDGATQIVLFRKPQQRLPISLRDLDPETLGGYLLAYESGLYRYVARVWTRMRKQDSHLLSVSGKRYKHVARLDWEITPNDSTPEASAQAEFLSDFFSELRVYDPGQQTGSGLKRALAHLMAAHAYGYAGCEIVWRPGAGQDGSLRADLIKIRPEYFEETGGVMQFYADSATLAQPLIPDKFVIHRADDCLMLAGSILWLLKYTCLSGWAAYCDKYGMPALIGEAPLGANATSVQQLQSMLENWAANLAAVLPAGYKANVVDPKGAGVNPYEGLANWCDAAQSVLWLGGDLTTQSSSGTGTLAGSAHKENEQEMAEDDAGELGETLDEQLSAPAIRFQFGQPLLAHFKLKVAKAVDLIAAIGVDTALVTTFGLKLSVADVRAKYGWREPDPGEEVVVPATPPASSIGLSPTSIARSADSGVDGTALKAGLGSGVRGLGEADLAKAYELLLAPMKAAIAEATSVEDLKVRLAKVKTDAGPFADALGPILEAGLRQGWDGWLRKTAGGGAG